MEGNAGLPKLHGWITPEYAMQMIKDLDTYLDKNGITLGINPENGEVVFTKCQCLFNAQDAIS